MRQGIRSALKSTTTVVEVQPVLEKPGLLLVFVAAADDVEIGIAVAVSVEKQGGHVLVGRIGRSPFRWRFGEIPLRILQVHRPGLTGSAAVEHIFAPVSVYVGHGDRSAELGRGVGQKRLFVVVVVLVLLMAKINPAELRCSSYYLRGRRCRVS